MGGQDYSSMSLSSAIMVTLKCLKQVLVNPEIPLTSKIASTPLYIVGSGRCGTTLLRRLLSRDPRIHIPPELHGLHRCVIEHDANWYRRAAWPVVVRMVYSLLESEVAFYSDHAVSLTPLIKSMIESPPENASIATLIDAFYRYHSEVMLGQEALLWVDKTPANIRYLDYLIRLFPEARFVHLIRDGRDVVASTLKAGHAETLNQACRIWNTALNSGAAGKAKELPILNVYYEDLVRSPESEIVKIYDFWGVEMPDKFVEVDLGDEKFKDVTSKGFHQNLTEKISLQSIGKYRESLTDEEIALVEHLCGPNLKKAGYL